MCRFVPGRVVALAPKGPLQEIGPDLPGKLRVQPLIPEDTDGGVELRNYGVGVLATEPGAELYAISQLSAALGPLVKAGQAVVDLDHYLPFGSAPSGHEARFSDHAEKIIARLREQLRSISEQQPNQQRLTVGILDSGIAPDYQPHREWQYFDYSSDGRLRPGEAPQDPNGHGTRVFRILDSILPPEVEVVTGRLPNDPTRLTTLSVASALGDLVARTSPDVVNLSIAIRDDTLVCANCRARVPTPAFMPAIFSMLLRLIHQTNRSTVTVMAAGNNGQVTNSRWLNPELGSLILAVAQNRKGQRARYSNAPEGPLADLFSVRAFGGDDPCEEEAVGMFSDGTHGTSFAAPLVTAATLLGKSNAPSGPAYGRELSRYARRVLDRTWPIHVLVPEHLL